MGISVSRSALRRVAVSLDPAVTSGEEADDTGIIVCGCGPCQPETCKLVAESIRCPGHGYVLADLTCHVAPREWARIAVKAYHDWMADIVVGEVNNGGDLIGLTIRAIEPGIPYHAVRATRGKQLRAEPASALYDQGRVHHLGVFPELEDQMATWTLDARWSPDRLDALVWGLTELGLIGAQGAAFLAAWAPEVEHNRRMAGVPKGPEGLPRLEPITPAPACKCRQPRFFQGVCVHCGGPQPA